MVPRETARRPETDVAAATRCASVTTGAIGAMGVVAGASLFVAGWMGISVDPLLGFRLNIHRAFLLGLFITC
jgi:hypothetical protein